MPPASIRTSTSPAPGTGSATASTRRSLAAWSTAARISFLPVHIATLHIYSRRLPRLAKEFP